MLHTIQNEKLSVTVAEEGAELQSILGCDGTEYLWQGNPAYWNGRSPTIFPYVGRMTGGTYYLDEQQYAMRIHGMAPYTCFQVEEKTADRLSLVMSDTAETLAQYPRRFLFRVVYSLSGSRLNITYQVENRDEKPMYFGLGGHPGINVPLVSGIPFEQYRLRFSEVCEPELALLSEKRFLTGEYVPYSLENGTDIPLQHSLFDNDAIVLRKMASQVTLETDSDHHSVTVGFPQMPYLGFWHVPLTDAPYVCIEPWASLPSVQDRVTVLEKQGDLIRLEAGGVYTNNWYLSVT